MMDELELLKKDWKKKDEHLPKLSYDEIYTMIWKKSFSIVRWIFYISIVELFIWIVLNTMPFYTDSFDYLEIGFSKNVIIATSIVAYGAIFIFLYYLYHSFKAISVVDNVKDLMKSILKTRKIVRYYVLYNIVVMFIVTIYSLIIGFKKDERFLNLLNSVKEDNSELQVWLMVALIYIIALCVTVGFIVLFYQIIYGFLLRKLNKNYKELKRLEL